MENSAYHYSCVLITVTLCALAILVCFMPIMHRIKGTVTDWIGNDDGFGIKIDGVTYWLNYSGEFISNVSMPYIVGRNCTLIYYGTILNPRGDCSFYADLIILVIK